MIKKLDQILGKIPAILSSRGSIFIYLFLFFYLVIFAILCLVVPLLNPLAPTSDAQLILGNYTNVLSALGASIAAGAGVASHNSMKEMHKKHDRLEKRIEELHSKIDNINAVTQQEKE